MQPTSSLHTANTIMWRQTKPAYDFTMWRPENNNQHSDWFPVSLTSHKPSITDEHLQLSPVISCSLSSYKRLNNNDKKPINEGLVLHFYVLCCWKTESISRSSVSSAQHSDSQGLLIRLISADDRKQELLQTPGVGGEQSGQRFVQYDIQWAEQPAGVTHEKPEKKKLSWTRLINNNNKISNCSKSKALN